MNSRKLIVRSKNLVLKNDSKVVIEMESGSVLIFIEITDKIQSKHILLPNGLSVDR